MTIFESKWGAATIPDTVDGHSVIFSADKKHSDATALIDAVTGEKVSFKSMIQSIDSLVAALYGSLKFKKWDVVAVFSPNHMQLSHVPRNPRAKYPVLVHALVKAGGTVSPANPTYNQNELAFQLKDSGAKYIFAHPAFLETTLAAAKIAGIPEHRIVLFDDASVTYPGPTRRTFNQICSRNTVPAPVVKFTHEEITQKPAYLCYSSGTTGLPKGVETTQFNVIANVLQFDFYNSKTREISPGGVWTGVLPFFHFYGLFLYHACLHQGCALVVFPKFELEFFLASLSKYEVTIAHIVPPIALALAKNPIVTKFQFPKLRSFASAAAPLAPEIVSEIHQRLGVPTFQAYGLSETSPITHMMPVSLALKNTKSIGLMFPNLQAKIVSPETGKDVPIGLEGELWVRGPNVMKGYHNNAKATAECIDKDGFFHTGDIVKVDANGFFYIVDRLKELIKYNAFQVAPAELEAYLIEHPAVADVAVIGRPHEASGEVPRAFVVLKPNVKCTEAELVAFIDKKVAPHKKLRGGVEFIAEIPKSASGKILRRVLRVQDADNLKKAKL
ncbi:hypothetical protein HDU98_011718 [Podochytrium sp. JEL0797]|nr:hypothetical protein HDU98_011718 [Podochytrium sp. JEL0797]